MLVTYQRELSYLLILQALREPVHCIQIGNETFLYLVEHAAGDNNSDTETLDKLMEDLNRETPGVVRYDGPTRPLESLLISKRDDIGIGLCRKVGANVYVCWSKKENVSRVQKIFNLLLQLLDSADEKFDTYKAKLTDAIMAADIFEPKENSGS